MIDQVVPQFVKYMPDRTDMRDGTAYVSTEFSTAIHLCCCGCGRQVVTPIGDGGWRMTLTGNRLSLSPSIANRFACKSHYFIHDGMVEWA